MDGLAEVDLQLDRVPSDICPVCGESFDLVVSHWRHSATCSEVELHHWQHDVLTGALLVGGGLNSAGEYPSFEIALTNKQLLEWLDSQMGVFTGSLTKIKEDRNPKGGLSFSGEEPTPEDFEDLYLYRTKSLKQLAPYASRWYDDAGERTVPEDVEPTPLMLKTAYALKGNIDPALQRPAITMTSTSPSETAIEHLFGEFAPLTKHKNSLRVYLQDGRGFFEFIGKPVPGAEGDWGVTNLPERSNICPTCGGRFQTLAKHWVKTDLHEPPTIPADLRDVLDGLLLAGARPRRSGPGKYYRFEFATSSRQLISWVDELLEWLSNGFSTISTAEESQAAFMERFDRGDSDAGAVYEARTCSHPAFDSIVEELEADPDVYFLERRLTPRKAGLLFARMGSIQGEVSARYLTLRPHRLHISTTALAELFEQWDPSIIEENGYPAPRFTGDAIEALLEYIELSAEIRDGLDSRVLTHEPS